MKYLLSTVPLLATALPAVAVTTSHWTQSPEADFRSRRTHAVVTANRGYLRRSRSVKTLLAESADGSVYAGTGRGGLAGGHAIGYDVQFPVGGGDADRGGCDAGSPHDCRSGDRCPR